MSEADEEDEKEDKRIRSRGMERSGEGGNERKVGVVVAAAVCVHFFGVPL